MFYYNINGENSIDPPEPEPNPNHPQIMWWRKPEILQTGADYEAGTGREPPIDRRLPPHLEEKLPLGLCPGGRAGTWYFVELVESTSSLNSMESRHRNKDC